MNTSRKPRTLAATLLAAGMLLVGAACGGGSPVAVADNIVTAADELTSPPSETFTAESIFIAECLNANGFDAPTTFQTAATARGVADIGGVFRSSAEAKKSGYPSTLITKNSSDPWSQFEAGLSAAERKNIHSSFSKPALWKALAAIPAMAEHTTTFSAPIRLGTRYSTRTTNTRRTNPQAHSKIPLCALPSSTITSHA